MAVGSFCASPAVFQPDNAPANRHDGSEVGIRRVGEAGIQFTLKCYRKASEAGNADAQAGLGQKYEDGEGVEQNYELAAECYRKAAEHVPDLNRCMKQNK